MNWKTPQKRKSVPRRLSMIVAVNSCQSHEPQAYQRKIIQSTGMATEMQLKVLFGKKSHGCPDFKKEKTTMKWCLFRRYF